MFVSRDVWFGGYTLIKSLSPVKNEAFKRFMIKAIQCFFSFTSRVVSKRYKSNITLNYF